MQISEITSTSEIEQQSSNDQQQQQQQTFNSDHQNQNNEHAHPMLQLRRSGGGGAIAASGIHSPSINNGSASAPSTAPILSNICPFMQPFSSKNSPEIDPFNRNETQKKVSKCLYIYIYLLVFGISTTTYLRIKQTRIKNLKKRMRNNLDE